MGLSTEDNYQHWIEKGFFAKISFLPHTVCLLLYTLFLYLFRLLNNEGSLLAYAGSNVNKDSKITAAVASNIWGAYEKGGKMAFNNEGLKVMFMDCEVSIINHLSIYSNLTCFTLLNNQSYCEMLKRDSN